MASGGSPEVAVYWHPEDLITKVPGWYERPANTYICLFLSGVPQFGILKALNVPTCGVHLDLSGFLYPCFGDLFVSTIYIYIYRYLGPLAMWFREVWNAMDARFDVLIIFWQQVDSEVQGSAAHLLLDDLAPMPLITKTHVS